MSNRNLALALLCAALSSTGCSGSDTPPMTTLPGGSAGQSSSAGASSTAGAAGSVTSSAGATGAVGGAGSGEAGASGATGGSGGGMSVGGAGGGAPGGAGAGVGGAAGASTGSGGMSGGGTVTPPPKGSTMGCTKAPPAGDSATAWIEHDIMVTEPLSQAAITSNPAKGGTFDWTHRNYFMRLPKNYDPTMPYRLEIGGSGCGGNDTVGSQGGYAIQNQGETNAIQVALSYLASTTNGGACFADNFVDPPDLEYFDAVLADLEAKFCIDKANVYMHGYSSGAWETYMLGCARAGIIRGIFTSQGGERLKRPACTGPVAALLSAGANADNDNPIGPLDPSSATAKSLDSLGAR